MPAADIRTLLPDTETCDSLILYRAIERWCRDNMVQDSWRLDWSGLVPVYGVDVPVRIIFKHRADLDRFYRNFSR